MNSLTQIATSGLQQLLEFLCKLEAHKLHYHLEHNRDESLMVLIAVPGERWEVEFFADAGIAVEIFGGSGGGALEFGSPRGAGTIVRGSRGLSAEDMKDQIDDPTRKTPVLNSEHR